MQDHGGYTPQNKIVVKNIEQGYLCDIIQNFLFKKFEWKFLRYSLNYHRACKCNYVQQYTNYLLNELNAKYFRMSQSSIEQ